MTIILLIYYTIIGLFDYKIIRLYDFLCRHHALTNEVGYDEDVALEPALFLWAPDPKNDVPWLRRCLSFS